MRLGKKQIVALVTAMGTLAVLLAGCGGSSSGNGNALPDSQQVWEAGLNAGAADIRRMDPGKTTDLYSFTVELKVFPGLVTLDQNLNVIPFAAQAMPTVSSDGLTYTFKIRPGLKWSDGTAIDANTFAYSLNRSLDPCTKSGGASYLYPIKGAVDFNTSTCDAAADAQNQVDSKTLVGQSIVVTDPQTLTITLEKPAAYFTSAMTVGVAMAQPKQLITQFGDKNWTDHLADNGGFGGSMYKLTTWDHKGNVVLDRNDAFWGEKPKIRQIHYHIYQDSQTEFNDYQTGKILNSGVPLAQYPEAKTRKDFYELPALAIGYWQPNWKLAPFDDVRVRQAFFLAIDRNTLSTNVDHGSSIPTIHIVPQGQPGYFADLKDPEGRSGTAALSADQAKAKELITAYANDKCGGDITKCPKVVLTTTNDPDSITHDTAVMNMFQQAMPGYPMSLNPIDFGTLLDQIYSPKQPQIWDIGWIVDYPDPQDWLSLQFLPANEGNTNTGNVEDATANDLMNKCDSTEGDARFTFCNQAEQELVTQGAWIPVLQQKVFGTVSPKLANFKDTPAGYIVLPTLSNIYLTK